MAVRHADTNNSRGRIVNALTSSWAVVWFLPPSSSSSISAGTPGLPGQGRQSFDP